MQEVQELHQLLEIALAVFIERILLEPAAQARAAVGLGRDTFAAAGAQEAAPWSAMQIRKALAAELRAAEKRAGREGVWLELF